MEKIVLNVNSDQKEILLKLFEMLHIEVETEPASGDQPTGTREELKNALDACSGMWKDLPLNFDEYRKQVWGSRGI